MFSVLNNFKTANNVLFARINRLKKNGYHIFLHKEKMDSQYTIDRITIKSKNKTRNRLVISAGLHGIEGYVGHAAIHTFFDTFLEQLNSNTEIIIYPALNPYGMDTYQRTNKNNVDLNRNFSRNNFTSTNEKYQDVQALITPRPFKNFIQFSSQFYTQIAKLTRRYKLKYLYEAFSLGQNEDKNGLYYSGKQLEFETDYILKEYRTMMKSKVPLTWIDIHSGYGPKNQMSIINSKYEVDVTNEMIKTSGYPAILGAQEDDIYDTDGDILEMLYEIKEQKFKKVDLYATCFEFGTVGASTLKNIEVLKSLIAMNHVRCVKENVKIKDKAIKLIKKQFAPKSEKWRIKAAQDFIQAMNVIIEYKKLA